MRDDRGFSLVLLLALLPVLLAALTAVYVFVGLIEDRASSRNHCRRALLEGLEKAAMPIQELLALNPEAQILRVARKLALHELEIATASGFPPAIAHATATLEAITIQQEALTAQQQALITNARVQIRVAQLRARLGILNGPMGFLRNSVVSAVGARPAVHPDASGLAPLYELDDPYEAKQKVEQKWQSAFRLTTAAGNFLKAAGLLEEKCAATLVPDGFPWRARLAEDK